MDSGEILLFLGKVVSAYQLAIKPLCKKVKMSQTAIDVLVFVHNNPKTTAKDICESKGLKANLVSMCIDKLVETGYVERLFEESDRRVVKLVTTTKANGVIDEHNEIQRSFWKEIGKDLLDSDIQAIKNSIDTLSNKIDGILNPKSFAKN